MDHLLLLDKYKKQLETDPHHKIFAVYAEALRKNAQYREAIKILREGLRIHPDYLLAILCLGQCLIDLKKFDDSYLILSPWASRCRDHIKFQRIFGDLCFDLGKLKEAMDAYQSVLFYVAKDQAIIDKINCIEQIENSHTLNNEIITSTELVPSGVPLFSIPKANLPVDEWAETQYVEHSHKDLSSGRVEYVVDEDLNFDGFIIDDLEIQQNTPLAEGFVLDSSDQVEDYIDNFDPLSVEIHEFAKKDLVLFDQKRYWTVFKSKIIESSLQRQY